MWNNKYEILFQAKMKTDNGHNLKGIWVEGHYVELIDGKRKIPCIYGYGEVIPGTVRQFTNCYDKEGTKIFRGDILESHYDKDYPKDFCYEVVMWKDNGWHMKQEDYDPEYLDGEDTKTYSKVVGNIWDNPELLKGGKPL